MCKERMIYIPLIVTLFEHKTTISADLVILIVIDPKVDQLWGKGTLHIYLSDSDIVQQENILTD